MNPSPLKHPSRETVEVVRPRGWDLAPLVDCPWCEEERWEVQAAKRNGLVRQMDDCHVCSNEGLIGRAWAESIHRHDGARLRLWRLDHNMSLDEAAKHFNVDPVWQDARECGLVYPHLPYDIRICQNCLNAYEAGSCHSMENCWWCMNYACLRPGCGHCWSTHLPGYPRDKTDCCDSFDTGTSGIVPPEGATWQQWACRTAYQSCEGKGWCHRRSYPE